MEAHEHQPSSSVLNRNNLELPGFILYRGLMAAFTAVAAMVEGIMILFASEGAIL